MRISDKDRQDIFEAYGVLEHRLRNLKSIVQNPIELTHEDLEDHKRFTNALTIKLGELNKYICDRALSSKNE